MTLTNLIPATRYYYRVGSDRAWSRVLSFASLPPDNDTNWTPRLAFYGDLGFANARSLPSLVQATRHRAFDMVLHLGDIGVFVVLN